MHNSPISFQVAVRVRVGASATTGLAVFFNAPPPIAKNITWPRTPSCDENHYIYGSLDVAAEPLDRPANLTMGIVKRKGAYGRHRSPSKAGLGSPVIHRVSPAAGACVRGHTTTVHSYRSASAGRIRVADHDGYNVATNETSNEKAPTHKPSTSRGANGT